MKVIAEARVNKKVYHLPKRFFLHIWYSPFQIVLSLYYVHQNQILHRDLKTQNIFLTRSLDHVKIGDFGISKILSTKSKAFTVVGTPCYISPELCEGGHFVDSRWGLQFLLLQYHSNFYAFLTSEVGKSDLLLKVPSILVYVQKPVL